MTDVCVRITEFTDPACPWAYSANLVPGLDRRDPPGSVEEVLRWSGTPLATQEIAVVCDIDRDRAREELGRVAVEHHVGADGFWTLPGAEAPAGGHPGRVAVAA